jgi:hypothetical protein
LVFQTTWKSIDKKAFITCQVFKYGAHGVTVHLGRKLSRNWAIVNMDMRASLLAAVTIVIFSRLGYSRATTTQSVSQVRNTTPSLGVSKCSGTLVIMHTKEGDDLK